MRIAILGGSFDPVHLGHLFLADSVLSMGYDRIVLIPAFQSPFKINASSASPNDRLDMLCASIAGDPRLTVDACEIQREGVSYTIDTIKEIKERYRPDGKPGLILGDDLTDTFHLWRNAASIPEEAEIILARRLVSGASAITREFLFPHKKLDNELMDISSRLVREKIKEGKNWRYLVPLGARCIIEDRKLYDLKTHDGISSLHETIVLLENAVRRIVSLSRFLHSRNTAILARDLCIRFHLDPSAGYLAGIVHDMCKSMEADELIRLALEDGRGISDLEKEKPGLLHGRAAAVFIQKHYKIKDQEILDSVSSHVTGGPDMSALAKIIYIADKIEVTRNWPPLRIRELCEEGDLDELFEAVLEDNVTFLHSQRKEIAEGTLRLLAAMGEKSAARISKGKP